MYKRVAGKILRITGIAIAILLALVVVLVLCIRIPAVQQFIAGKAIGFVQGKTHTKMQLRKLYINFPNTVVVEGLFAEDLQHDTLLHVEQLNLAIDMLALLNKQVSISSVQLTGANAYIHRGADSVFNFAFIIKAFAGTDTTTVKKAADTTATPWQVQVSKVLLSNIRARYYDEAGGTDIKGHIGSLALDMKAMDINHLSFDGNELALRHTDVSIDITGGSTGDKTPDTAIVLMPLLSLQKLELEQVKFRLGSPQVNLNINAGSLLVKPETIDLNNHIVNIKQLQLAHTTGAIALNPSADTTTVADTTAPANWQVSAGSLLLDTIDFKFDMTAAPHIPQGVDYNHLHIQQVRVDIKDVAYSNTGISGVVNHLSLTEQSGLIIKKLAAQVQYSDTHAQLNGLTLLTNRSGIGNNIQVTYPSIKALATNVGALGINAQLRNTFIAVDDILFFAPQLKQQKIIAANRGKVLTLSGNITGLLSDITAQPLQARLTGGTAVAVRAHIKGLPDALNAWYDVTIDSLHTTAADVQAFSNGAIPATIQVPGQLWLTGMVKGTLHDAVTHLKLNTTAGNLTADASLKMAAHDTTYIATVTTQALNLGYILRNDTLLGPVTLQANVKGSSFTPATMHDSLMATIQSAWLMGHTYNNITVDAVADSNTYAAVVNINDTTIQLTANAAAGFVTGSEYITATANIAKADLQGLKLWKDELTLSGNVQAQSKGPVANLNATAGLYNFVFYKGSDTYRLDSLVARAQSDSNSAALTVNSDLLQATYNGNVQLTQLGTVLMAHANRYFSFNDSAVAVVDTLYTDTLQQFSFKAQVLPHPLLTQLLVPGLQNFTGANLTADYNRANSKMDVGLTASSLAYAGVKATDVTVKLTTTPKQLDYRIGLTGLTTGPIHLTETSLDGTIANNNIGFALHIHGSDTLDKLRIGGNLNQDSTRSYVLHLDNERLIIGNQPWALANDNYIRFGNKGLYFNNFKLSNNSQALSIVSAQAENGSIQAAFDNFELGSLSQIIEADTPLLRGVLNGTAELRNLNRQAAFIANLTIDSVAVMQQPVGNLTVKADNLTANKYTAQATLTGNGNNVQVTGAYTNTATDNALNFNVAIDKLNLTTVEPFTMGQLRRSSGYITGALKVTGAASQPVIAGDVYFKDAAFNLTYINNYLRLKNEHLAIDGKGIYFRSFTVLDSLGQRADLTGAVYTTDFKHMRFDAALKANGFTVLNTTIRDNPLFFGRVLLNADIAIKGNEALPVVTASVKLLQGTNLAVLIPGGKINTDRGEGVVIMEDSLLVIDNGVNADSLLPGQITGIKLSANVDITPQTTLKLIVDKSSGDSLVIRGEGLVSFSINESGNQSMVGTYFINSGSYRATFQKVVKRELAIQPGGYITWNGSPTDADVNITAVYTVTTPASDLMGTALAGASTAERNLYKKPLTFNVLMTMKGELLKPEIGFRLDMSEQDQNAFGGAVYSRVQQLNNDPSELNKQVFALIVLKSFIPTGVGGSGDVYATAATNMARNSLNQVLTDQLNRLSGQYVKWVDLTVGINNNDEYTQQGVNQGTQFSVGLKKSFLNDRLSVQVGTSVNVQNNGEVKGLDANNLTGDIVVEYKINPDGSLRFKAFRENQYEGLIDGSVYKTGVGVVMSRDYDTEKELFRKKTAEEKEAEKAEEQRLKEEAQRARDERKRERAERKEERRKKKEAKKQNRETGI